MTDTDTRPTQPKKILASYLWDVPKRLLAEMIQDKLAGQGIAISIDNANFIAENIVIKREDGEPVGFRRSGVKALVDLKLVLSAADFSRELDARARELLKSLPDKLEELSAKTAADMVRNAENQWPEVSRSIRGEMIDFRNELYRKWKDPIEKLRLLRTVCFELGSEFARDLNENPPEDKDSLREALVVSHVRACQIAEEILFLIEGGFADGAMARCRSLHEIAVIVMFLSMHGEEVARRYLAHKTVDFNEDAVAYHNFMQESGGASVDDRDSDVRIAEYRKAIEEFGKEFKNPYGWAADCLNNQRPSFRDIEKLVFDENARHLYRMANQSIHVSARNLYSRPGLPKDGPVLLAGPSYLGLAEPGMWVAVSLAMVTVNLFALREANDAQAQFEYSTAFRYVMKCHDVTVESFQAVQSRIDENS